MPVEKPVVAAFDFDGTITKFDLFQFFLFHSVGVFKGIIYLILLTPSFFQYLFGGLSRTDLKERLLTMFLKDLPYSHLLKQSRKISFISLFTRPEALKKLSWHQQQNHRCIIVSANIDIFLQAWAELMGFHDLLASKLQVDSQDKITGKLGGPNCRGLEKVKKLEELLGSKDSYILYSYGDSDGDRELLALADYPFYRRFL